MGEALLRDRLTERGVAADIRSAGTMTEGLPPTDEIIELMDDRSLDVREHRSQILTRDHVSGADLVLGMAREHVREVVVLDPTAFPVTFTLKELVRLGAERGPRQPGETVADWLAEVGAGRTPMGHLGLGSDEDVIDPMGRRFAVYSSVAEEIEELVDELVELLWPT